MIFFLVLSYFVFFLYQCRFDFLNKIKSVVGQAFFGKFLLQLFESVDQIIIHQVGVD
jgi:hypothetical protein